jgi:chromate transporter
MIYWTLFWVFFRLGAFSFGGGYAMISLIQREMLAHQWLTTTQFSDIVAISQMTPGPIAINAATYVGYKVAGLVGSAIATIGVILPSLILILLVSKFLIRWQKHPLNQMVFYGLRPVIIGLIAVAAVDIGKISLLRAVPTSWADLLQHNPFLWISPLSLGIFALTVLLEIRFKVNPIITIILAGLISGVVLSLI